MNDSYIYLPYFYDMFIRVLVEVITYILFVSSSAITDLLLNCVAVTFLTDLDEFFGNIIQS